MSSCAYAPKGISLKGNATAKLTLMEQAIELLDQGKLEESQVIFEDLANKKSTKFAALMNLGIIATQQKNFISAENYFTQAYKIKPNSAVVLNNLGIVNRHLKHHQKSEDFYLQAIQQDASNADYWFNLGILYELYLGNNLKALESYNKYQSFLSKPDPKVNGWVKRLENEL